MRGIALLFLAGCSALSMRVWAAEAAAPGVANFHQVTGRIYRGAQPDAKGWDSLAKLGVKTIIDLRPEKEHSCKAEKRAVEAAGMHYVNAPLNGAHAPSDRNISKVLGLLDDSASPIFVHCRRGADRTGTVIACYRITHDGWNNRRALQEATSFGMSWFEFGMQRYVLAFRAAGAANAPPALPQPPPPAPPQPPR
jgi:tyrosine-protein phosphatase SIW14